MVWFEHRVALEHAMRNRFDQVSKRILRGALEPGGAVANELEVPAADAQAVDTWFEPAPERVDKLERAGLYLMSTQDLYEQWERATTERGREQEARRVLSVLYEARFGVMPRAFAEVIEAMHDTATLERWLVLVGTQSQGEVAAAVQAEGTPQPERSDRIKDSGKLVERCMLPRRARGHRPPATTRPDASTDQPCGEPLSRGRGLLQGWKS
jgi:hypothetical protein